MLLALLFCPSSYVLRHVRPVAEAVHLGAFDQEELLVGAPVGVEDGERVAVDHPVGVVRPMRSDLLALQETLVKHKRGSAQSSTRRAKHAPGRGGGKRAAVGAYLNAKVKVRTAQPVCFGPVWFLCLFCAANVYVVGHVG